MNKKGQGLVEYALIIGLILVVGIAVFTANSNTILSPGQDYAIKKPQPAEQDANLTPYISIPSGYRAISIDGNSLLIENASGEQRVISRDLLSEKEFRIIAK